MLLSTVLCSGFAAIASAASLPVLASRADAPAYTAHTIDQPIDHFPHSARYAPHTKDTFKQRYWMDSTYYKPGGPVYLYIGGETAGENRFSNLQTGIVQILMEATNGLGVILENRYYGDSYPYADSSTDHLAYLTTEQTIADNAYFAEHVKFPGIEEDLSAPKTDWILYGGSLAGAQTAFSVKTYPHLFFGGIASSGTTLATLTYPQWYDPIQRLAPQDCVHSINGIIDKFDRLVSTDNKAAVQQFKEFFGLGALKDNRDFAMTIAFPIGGPMNYPTNTWQELNWNPAYGYTDFFDFCRNVTNADASPSTTAIDTALSRYSGGKPWTNLGNYAAYVKRVIVVDGCTSAGHTVEFCYNTQNQTLYADTTNGGGRSYLYSTCTESGAYQVAPKSGPSLISRVLQIDYTQQWCTWAFPKGKYNSIPSTPDLGPYNSYGGLNVEVDRLAKIDGDNDVWLDLCYHSHFAPEPRQGSDLRPEYLISGSGHHWDSYGIKDVEAEPQFIREAHLWEIRTVKKWLKLGRGYKTEL